MCASHLLYTAITWFTCRYVSYQKSRFASDRRLRDRPISRPLPSRVALHCSTVPGHCDDATLAWSRYATCVAQRNSCVQQAFALVTDAFARRAILPVHVTEVESA